jgi:hypothetical protein
VIADLAKRGVVIGRSWLSRAENGAPMSEELLRAFEDYYGSVAPPYEPPMASSGEDATKSELAALIASQAELTGAIRELAEALRGPAGLDRQLVEAAALDIAAVDPAAGKPQRRTTSPRRRRGPDRRDAATRPLSPEDGR